MGPNYTDIDLLASARHYININNGLVACFASALIVYYYKSSRKANSNEWSDGKRSSRKLPGPGQHFLGSIANFLAVWDETKCLKVFENWCKEYGPLFQLNFGPYKLTALNSPEYVQKLLGSKDTNYLGKGFIYKPFHPYWDDGLIITKGDKWKSRRRILEKYMFSFKTVSSYMKIFNEEGDTLVHAIGDHFNDGMEKDIEKIVMKASLQSITNATFGKSLADFESLAKCELGFMEAICRMKELVAKRVLAPYLLLDFIWKLHPLSTLERLVEKVLRKHAVASIMDESEQPLKKHGASMKQDLAAAGVPLEGIIEESQTLIGAGFETTATSLHFLLFFLALHPHHQELCRDEVDSIFEDVDLCPSGFIQFRALSKLKHLEMCVYETLRLLPTVFLMMRKIDAPLQLEEDLEIPAGSDVGIYVPGLHKNPKYFPNPDNFIPERFSLEQSKTRHPYAFIPFAAGPRKCIGYKFAMMEMLSLAAKLLRNYEWETTEKLENVVLLPHITITPKNPMKFLFKKRLLTNHIVGL
ncbi:unnamed protein product [Orchesella dallaii]|uniref:Uncharacterized protein n=1 Tax=Orchesella dallaii TaxID=48710 RepID=A0ABP1Q139_9HEXA